MIERRRPHSYVRADHELIAGFEIFEVQIRLHRLKRDRKCRLRHLPSEDTTNAIIAQVARHDAKLVAWGEARTKERKPVDVVPMAVREKQVSRLDAPLHKAVPKRPNARARIQNNGMLTRSDFQTAGVAPVAHVAR